MRIIELLRLKEYSRIPHPRLTHSLIVRTHHRHYCILLGRGFICASAKYLYHRFRHQIANTVLGESRSRVSYHLPLSPLHILKMSWPRDFLLSRKALFFLMTNLLVIFGHVAFDRGYCIVTMTTVNSAYTSSGFFSSAPFSVIASCAFTSSYVDNKTVIHQLDLLRDTSVILKRKSRSFWTASSIFEGPLRVDLINL